MHPLLLPGTHLLRRDAETVQAGLTLADRCVLPATADSSLRDDARVASALVRAGLATADDAPLRAALPGGASGNTWLRHTVAALARRTGERLPTALERRASRRIEVRTFGHPMAAALAEDLSESLDRAGLAISTRAVSPTGSSRDALRVLVGVGEPRRDLVDPLASEGTPYVVVRLVEGSAVIGPFVVPGETACLRCVDAYLTERDPAWPLLVEQYARASERDRADGIPEPVDAALAAVALGWVARDVASYAEGERPSTWSATVRLAPLLDDVDVQRWPPHPHCGCAWS